MKKTTLIGIFVLVAVLATASMALAAGGGNFRTHLSGGNEVPARETLAQGQAIFRLNADGTELYFKLIATNIDNVVGAHIHVGAEGVNGPVVVPLFSATPGGGRQTGILSEGVITSASLVGPMAGMSLSDLMSEIEAGKTYVNVHTNDGVAPTNTGAGDFPGGEIRGQIHGGDQ